MKKLVAIMTAVSLISLAGCSHTLTIDSDPEGALIRVNGEKIGKAPASYTEKTGFEKAYQITAEKPGFKKTTKSVKQTEWHLPVVIASVLLAFPTGMIGLAGLLFSQKLPDRVVVELEAEDEGEGGSESSGSPAPGDYGY